MYQYKKIINMSVCIFTCYSLLSCSDSSSDSGSSLDFKKAIGYIDENKTDLDKNYPHFYVTNLSAEHEVQVSLYEDVTCNSHKVSDTKTTKGTTTLKLKNPLKDDGVHTYYIKQSYGWISTCSSAIKYSRKHTHPVFTSFLHERGYKTGYPNKNRGLILSKTKFNNKIEIYTGTDCEDKNKYVNTITSLENTTEIETLGLADGNYNFSIKELDSNNNPIGCWTSKQVELKPIRFLTAVMEDALNITQVELDKSKDSIDIFTTVKLEKKFNKKIKNMYQVSGAVILLFEDGSIKTSGSKADISSIASKLNGNPPVISLYTTKCSTQCAFAALRSDGSVITWGDAEYGGDSSTVADKLTSGVVRIFANFTSFAALKSDGSVVTWGSGNTGGNPSDEIKAKLNGGVINIFSTGEAYAALKSDGSVVCWGIGFDGGNPSDEIKAKLTSGVTNIYSTDRAFAALKSDGSVVSWGAPGYGGNPSEEIKASLNSGVTSIYSTYAAFTALKSDGSVVSWGAEYYGGNPSNEIKVKLTSGVSGVYSTYSSFAALKSDGSVVTWGSAYSGGNPSEEIKASLSSGVVDIFSNSSAFAALKKDGSLITWGSESMGGDSSLVASQINGSIPIKHVGTHNAGFYVEREDGQLVKWYMRDYIPDNKSILKVVNDGFVTLVLLSDHSVKVFSSNEDALIDSFPGLQDKLKSGVTDIFTNSNYSFVAIKEGGQVITWGEIDDPEIDGLSSGVTKIVSNASAFAALKENGSVITWGDSSLGGDSSGKSLSSGVTDVYSTYGAFAALKSDGSVITWGDEGSGGSTAGEVSSFISSGVEKIISNGGAFAALKSGKVVSWGDEEYGGDYSEVLDMLSSGVTDIYANSNAFLALKSNGSVITWGDPSSGGTTAGEVSSFISSGVEKIISTAGAFAALKSGRVVSWGNEYYGGDYSEVSDMLSSGVNDIYSNNRALVAVKSDSIISWGAYRDSEVIWDVLPVSGGINNIFSAENFNTGEHAFMALKSNGSLMSWGSSKVGGDSSKVSSLINGTVPVTQVYPFQYGFIVVRQDGMKLEVSPDVLWFN